MLLYVSGNENVGLLVSDSQFKYKLILQGALEFCDVNYCGKIDFALIIVLLFISKLF